MRGLRALHFPLLVAADSEPVSKIPSCPDHVRTLLPCCFTVGLLTTCKPYPLRLDHDIDKTMRLDAFLRSAVTLTPQRTAPPLSGRNDSGDGKGHLRPDANIWSVFLGTLCKAAVFRAPVGMRLEASRMLYLQAFLFAYIGCDLFRTSVTLH